jgi:uncharacterized protein YbaR (Trm112 family)
VTGAGEDEDGARPEAPDAAPEADRRMLAALVCPVTLAPLAYDPERQELVSRAAHLAFPIRGGIPIMLPGEAREVE